MINNSKKLPCGHIFHTPCLRSWFQRQQTCPTCRLNILRAPVAADQNQAGAQANPNQGINNERDGGGANANNNNGIPPNPFMNLMGATPTAAGLQNNSTAVPLVPGSPLILPPFPFITPYVVPPPPMPPNLDALSDEELRLLEGNERRNVEERIKLLRNIQLMMDASVALMSQYSAITARLPPLPPPPPSISQPTAVEPQPSTSTTEGATPVIQPTAPTLDIPSTSNAGQTDTSSQVDVPTSKLTDVKLEDVGSEDYLDLSPKDTKDSKHLGTQLEHIDDPNDPMSELRRRRLQKFLQQESNGNNNEV